MGTATSESHLGIPTDFTGDKAAESNALLYILHMWLLCRAHTMYQLYVVHMPSMLYILVLCVYGI